MLQEILSLSYTNSSNMKIVYGIVLFSLVIERVSNTFRKKGVKARKIFHERFFYVLLISYLLIVLFASINFFLLKKLFILPIMIGSIFLLAGILIRRNAIKSLNKLWSVFIEIKENQQIVNTGIYRILKHPYYLAVILELSGFSFISNSIVAVLLTVFMQFPLVLIRIHYEERVLKIFGRRFNF